MLSFLLVVSHWFSEVMGLFLFSFWSLHAWTVGTSHLVKNSQSLHLFGIQITVSTIGGGIWSGEGFK